LNKANQGYFMVMSLCPLNTLDKKESAGVEQRGWDTPHFA
jgi:hypothetical protein